MALPVFLSPIAALDVGPAFPCSSSHSGQSLLRLPRPPVRPAASRRRDACFGPLPVIPPVPLPVSGLAGPSADVGPAPFVLDIGPASSGLVALLARYARCAPRATPPVRRIRDIPRAASPVVTLLAALLAAGCASTPDVGTDVAATGMPNAELALRESMRLVDAQMSKLGTMGPAPVQRGVGPVVPGELQKVVVFSWTGTLEDGVRKLADSIGYAVAVAPPPAGQGPVEVGVATGQVQILQAFQALGEAAGSRAMVRVDPVRRQVDVVYRV